MFEAKFLGFTNECLNMIEARTRLGIACQSNRRSHLRRDRLGHFLKASFIDFRERFEQTNAFR